MEDLLTRGLEQAPSLVIFAATLGWIVKAFLGHLAQIMDDHNLIMKEVLDRNTEALEANTETLGAAKEALRNRSNS